MHRSSLNDLLHRAARQLEPIYQRLLTLVGQAHYVNADETSQPVMDHEKCRRGFMWTFIGDDIVCYVFSPDRSGDTPNRVLGQSSGSLQDDGYTGYNHVSTPGRRTRAGCLAHARRYFFNALGTHPEEVDHVLALIRALYNVEKEAEERGLTGTPEHAVLRRVQSAAIMAEWKTWLQEQQLLHPPKGPLGRAISYTLNQWDYLTRFLTDAKIRLDNNISEGALRIIALGRDNFRWVGSDKAGHNLAVLQTIVATCISEGINPYDYIKDVIIRVNHHPASELDALLPSNWKPPPD